MSLAELCVRRPIGTFLLAIGLFLVGMVAFFELPIAPLPHVDFPTINVSAKLPGADPVTMAATVAAPLERRLGQIAGISELTSNSAQGSTSITAQFDLDRDIEGAAHDVQAAINASGSDLPVDLPTPPTYRKMNPADSPILILAVTSQQLSQGALYDACDSILVQRISQVKGVAQVTIGGADKPAVRVQANSTALAAAGLSMEELRSAVAAANVNRPLGALNGEKQAYAIAINSQLRSAESYGPLVIRSGNGTTLRLRDVANVIDGVENTRQAGWFNGGKAVIIIIQKQADANVIETVDAIQTIMPRLKNWMPAGTEITVLSDRTQTIRESVRDVEITLLISIVLVILVVLFALGRVTPTLAASITVPLSLAGTFAGMWLLGYSLDNISLMALTISVGFVVDDAIVMIENIAHYVERGMHPVAASIRGAREITFTVISISVSLVAVFVPLLFMGGIIGRMFREFAVTLTIAIAVSAVVSLTVTPAFYARLMAWRQSHGHTQHTTHTGERFFAWAERHYQRGLNIVLRHQPLTLVAMLLTIVLTVWLYMHVPKGFIPQQDTGLMMGTIEGRSDISFQALAAKQQEVTKIILADPAVEGMGAFVGSGGFGATGNQGRMFITLKPTRERNVSIDQVIGRLRPKFAKVDGVSVFLQGAQDIRVGGRSGKAQFQFVLWSESLEELREWAPRLIERLRREQGITDVSSDQDAAAQQVSIVVDRDMAARLGVDMAAVDEALQNAFAQRQISVIYTTRNQYRVVLEAPPATQAGPDALEQVYIKSTGGALVRLSTIARVERSLGPISVMHQGQFPAATLTFNLPEGAALGDATDRIQKAAREIHLPASIHSGFAGNAKAFADSLRNEPLLILAALVVIYIVLGMLYESALHPVTILSTLPSAGLGALLALQITGNDLSLISIIGVILLMGIVKKNGIMLVDFAILAEREGKAPLEAIREACARRFRPILMTTLAATLGALPLALAFGSGGELRRPLGIAIVGGLIVSQLLTLYTTPVVYLALARMKMWRHRRQVQHAV